MKQINNLNKNNSSLLIILLVILLIIISFSDLIPYLLNYKYYYDNNNTKFYNSLQSSNYIHSIVLIIGINIPLFLEILIDIHYINLNLVFPRILLIGGILLTNCIFYFSIRSITLFIGLYRARGVALAGGLIIFLFESHSSKYDKTIGVCTILTGIFYSAFTTWSDLTHNRTNTIILFVFRVIAGIQLICLCIWYFSAALKQMNEILSSTSKKLTLIYTVILAVYFFMVYGIWFIYGAQPWQNIGSNELVCYNILETCTMLAAVIFPSRLARLESFANEVI